MSDPLPESLLPALGAARAWLARCLRVDELYVGGDGGMWVFERDALGAGCLELADAPEAPCERETAALTLPLALPPVATAEDAHALLGAAVALPPGVAVTELGLATDEHTPAVTIRVPAAGLTPEALDALYARLARAKHALEDDAR